MTDVWRVHDDQRPRSLNRERNKHYMERARLVADEVDRWGWRFREVGLHRVRLDACGIDAFPTYKGLQQDAGNCYPTVKAAIDALESVGTITDDGPDVVRYVNMHAPDPTYRVDGLTLAIRREPSVRLDLAAIADQIRFIAETRDTLAGKRSVSISQARIDAARVALASLGFALESA